MAFELSADLLDGELAFQFSDVGSDYVVQIPIGFDAIERKNISLLVALTPWIGSGAGGYELIFSLEEMDETSGESLGRVWDGLHARRYLAKGEHRSLVMGALLSIIEFLIIQISPQLVMMTTHTAGLPNKALLKFNRIATLFCQNGYRSGQCDPWHGQFIWVMEKL